MLSIARPLRWLAALLAPTLATGLCLVLDRYMSVAGLAMVYLVVVVLAALALGRAPGLLVCLLSVTALNFFFIPPRYTFDVEHSEYWWILAVLLSLSLALNTLIAHLRAGLRRAEWGEARAGQLNALGQELARNVGREAMAAAAADWLHRTLRHPCAVFLAEPGAQDLRCIARGADPADFHPASVRWALAHGRPLGAGCEDWPQLSLWCAPFSRAHPAGAVQLLLRAADRPTAEQVTHWLELTRQVGLFLEREAATEAARQARDNAHAEAARNTLLASLSHDLRTPLAGLLGNASALRTQGAAMSAAQRERLLANLENDARDMTLMADNILQMARLSQPRTQLALQWESVGDILGAAVARMRRRWPQARIELRVAGDLPPLRGEAALLAQLVANLVDNAVRHGGEQPHIIVRAGRSREGVFVAVRDHGEGLPEDSEGLFDRYRRGETLASGSAGLGLTICALIAQMHGGRIQAQRCTPGAEFRADLPAAPETLTHA